MGALFLICAVAGGSVMVVQFVLTLIGFGGEAFDLDLPDDVDFDTDLDLDADFDAGVGSEGGGHLDSSWLFGVISLRTVIAALAFFGLAGLAGQAAGFGGFQTLVVAVITGVAAMYAVYYLIRSLDKLKSEGTAHVRRALGLLGTVYTTIPAEASGTGKIQLDLQNRTMEYLALTSGHALAPGAKVVITDVIASDTVQVEPAPEVERNSHA
ncbi:MAG: NfeD family protein [Pirellulales bacterium]|nr:NfeD family protein [Pirellulales bacterium]